MTIREVVCWIAVLLIALFLHKCEKKPKLNQWVKDTVAFQDGSTAECWSKFEDMKTPGLSVDFIGVDTNVVHSIETSIYLTPPNCDESKRVLLKKEKRIF